MDSIKKFECPQCKRMKFILILKGDKKNIGYLCEECWKIYHKRIKEIYNLAF